MAEYFYINTVLEQYFEERYPHDTDRTDYVVLLREMNDEHTAKGLLKIHDKLQSKILSLQYNNIPEDWYRYDYLPNNYSSLLEELDFFFNVHIKRLFDSHDELTDEKELSCLFNLKPAKNRSSIIDTILPKCSDDVKAIYEENKSLIELKEEAPKHLTAYNINTNERREYYPLYVKGMRKLFKLGYIKDKRDSAFEKRAGIHYYYGGKGVVYIILYIIAILILLVLIYFLITTDFSLITLILIIGIPGALMSFLKKG